MIVIDAVSRLVPGFVGNSESVLYDSFSTGLLEGPHYTKPREYEGWNVPDILVSGHQKKIDGWRHRESLRRTLQRRPDLLEHADLAEEDRRILEELRAEGSHPSS
jgi:tRNA (guanine37-N1)-methyltransferase